MFFKILSKLVQKIFFFTGSLSGRCFPPPLDSEREKQLLEDAKNGDISARNILIEHNMRLVAHVAKKYQGQYENDDLLSVGSIGLIKAVDTYKANKGTTLATYTAKCIENEILMLLRATKKFTNTISLNEPIGTDKDGNELTLIDLLMSGDEEVTDSVHKKINADKLFATMQRVLTKREYRILQLRYGLMGEGCYAQREVAVTLGISRSYVSRLEKKAIGKLKKTIKIKDFYC